jgi:hypothetical protein
MTAKAPDALQTLHLLRCGPHVLEVLADANADRLFVEGERDGARDDLAIARDHLEAANNAHLEAEKGLAAAEAREFALGVQV